MESGISNTDKLLICLAIILLLTIVWTILIGIMYKMRDNTTVVKKSKFLLDDDDDDDVVVVKSKKKKTTTRKTKTTKKASTKKAKTTKKASTRNTNKTTSYITSRTDKETYVKVKFYGTSKNLIYVAPENVILRKGDKVKVRTDEGETRTATIVQGNYTRDKYKTYEYQTLDLVE